jgi:hypothetical protein
MAVEDQASQLKIPLECTRCGRKTHVALSHLHVGDQVDCGCGEPITVTADDLEKTARFDREDERPRNPSTKPSSGR